MTKTIEAVVDVEVPRRTSLLDLEPSASYRILIQLPSLPAAEARDIRMSRRLRLAVSKCRATGSPW